MNDKARGKVIHEAQPFGLAYNHVMHGPAINGVAVKNMLAESTMVENRGTSVQISDADKNPSAYANACRNRDNPFAFVGLPRKQSHNNYDPRMHISQEVS